MKEYIIQLSEINDVKSFVDTVMNLPEDIDLVSGRYTVDAKSIMGIFSLDLSKPLHVLVHGDNDSLYESCLKPYFVEQ